MATNTKTNPVKLLSWSVMGAAAIFMVPGVVMLLVFGMIPGIVAWMIDRSPKKYATFCVGGMNLSGVFPAFLELWNGNRDIAQAIQILSNPFDLVIMFAAAAFGWLLYVFIPPIVVALLTVIAQHRIAELRGLQRKLIQDWGDGVAVGPEAMELAAASPAVARQGAAPPATSPVPAAAPAVAPQPQSDDNGEEAEDGMPPIEPSA